MIRNKYTEKELVYLKVMLLQWRDIQRMFGKKQTKEWTMLINKISEDIRNINVLDKS